MSVQNITNGNEPTLVTNKEGDLIKDHSIQGELETKQDNNVQGEEAYTKQLLEEGEILGKDNLEEGEICTDEEEGNGNYFETEPISDDDNIDDSENDDDDDILLKQSSHIPELPPPPPLPHSPWKVKMNSDERGWFLTVLCTHFLSGIYLCLSGYLHWNRSTNFYKI